MSVTRRNFALSLGAAAVARAQISPIRRYIDPSTEVEVFALTDPAKSSYLPHPYNRAVSSRNGFIVFATETTQGLQAMRLEVKGGALRTITSSSSLDPKSLALAPDDRSLYFTDGASLLVSSISGGKPREIFKATSPEAFKKGFSLSEDGTAITLIDGARLVSIPTAASARSGVRVLAEVEPGSATAEITKFGHVFFRTPGGGLHLIDTTPAAKPKPLPIEGDLGPAIWNPDGNSILYLKLNRGKGVPNALFEYSLESKTESLVGKTSQYVHFGRNADSSVFVGASGSKAQPYVLLMLRITRREMAICEHKASDPSMVAPIFSPNSQRVYFQSDRLGKPVIFSVVVDRLVEKTEPEDPPSGGKF